MKRIITAINNPILNEELRKKEYIEVVGKDIQYKEEIIESLENNTNKKIDIIIISEELPGIIENKKLLELIKNKNEKIKIIYILEKENIEKENELKKLNINSIYYNNKITINEIINIISENEINKEEEMKKEIEKLKKIIERNNKIKKENLKNQKIKNKIKKLINKKIENNINKKTKKNNKIRNIKYKRKNKKEKNNKNKIIKIIGSPKTGKTTITLILSETLAKKNKKILLVDLDKNKKDLTKRLLIKNKIIKKYKNKKRKIKEIKIIAKKIKRRKNLNKTKKLRLILKNKKRNNQNRELKKINNNIFILNLKNQKPKRIINEIKKYEIFFDFIMVDTKNKNDLKEIDSKCKKVLIIEGKMLGIQELKRITYITQKNSHKSKNGLHIIINKANKSTIMKEILYKTLENIETIIYIKETKKLINLEGKKCKIKKLEKI